MTTSPIRTIEAADNINAQEPDLVSIIGSLLGTDALSAHGGEDRATWCSDCKVVDAARAALASVLKS